MKYIRVLIFFILFVILLAPPFSFLVKREETVTPVYFIDTSATMGHSIKRTYTDSVLLALSKNGADYIFFDGVNWPENFTPANFEFKLPIFITDGFIENSVVQFIKDKNAHVYMVGVESDETKNIASLNLEPDNSVRVQIEKESVVSDTLAIIVNQKDSFTTVQNSSFLLPSALFKQGLNSIDLHSSTSSEAHVFYNAQKKQNIIFSPTLSMDTRFWISIFRQIDPKIEVINSPEKFAKIAANEKFGTVVFIYPNRNFEHIEYEHAFYVLYDFVPSSLSEVLTAARTNTIATIFNTPPFQHALTLKPNSDVKILAQNSEPFFFRWQNRTVFLGRDIYKSDLFLVLVRRGLPEVARTIKAASAHFFNSPSFFIHNTSRLFTTGELSGRVLWNNFENFFVTVSNNETETVIDNFSTQGKFSSYIPAQEDTLTISAILNNNRFEPFMLFGNVDAEQKPIAHANRNIALSDTHLTDDPISFVDYRRELRYNQKIRIILDENRVVLLILLFLISLVWIGEFVAKRRI